MTKEGIVREGRMDSKDGRAFKMEFSRKRAEGKAPAKKKGDGSLNGQRTGAPAHGTE
ncbi:MAG: hypothetical protein OSA48_00215 [Akkermansiaceae bacterium]|nr:hypothetical protein [Akkermansiaceae bacterium]